MISPFLKTATKLLTPILVILSAWLLFRGHHHSGGGFIAALVLICAYVLLIFAFGDHGIQRLVPFDPRSLMGVGLLVTLSACLLPLKYGRNFFEAMWVSYDLPLFGILELGTPLLFDFGVYLVVVAGLTIILNSFEEN